MEFQGSRYYYKNKSSNGTRYYVCSKNRISGCKARLIVRPSTSDSETGEVVSTGEHTCTRVTAGQNDVRGEMREMIEVHALEEHRLPPSRIWANARDQMVRKYGELVGLRFFAKTEAVSLVKRLRRDATGGDIFLAIEEDSVRTVSATDQRNFLQFNMTYTIRQQYRRMLGFAHPDLMRLLRYEGVTLFIDGTFKVAPRPFKQTLIVMLYDRAHDLYIPVFYVLMDAKDDRSYYHAFQWIQVQCNQQCEPSAVLCDFEAALHQGVRVHFPATFIVGCLFDWKQALRRKMISLGIPADQISLAMEPGSLDTLTVVPKDQIHCKGVPYAVQRLHAKFDIRGHKIKWDKFWAYFKNMWTILYKPNYWNVSAMAAAHVSLVNRTNNPLEAYNRVLATRFGTTHPPLLSFINEIKVESVRYLQRLHDICLGRVDEVRAAPSVEYPPVPDFQ